MDGEGSSLVAQTRLLGGGDKKKSNGKLGEERKREEEKEVKRKERKLTIANRGKEIYLGGGKEKKEPYGPEVGVVAQEHTRAKGGSNASSQNKGRIDQGKA